jgi:hypothetical protein
MALQGTKLTLLRLSQAQARSSNTDLRGNKDQDPAINHRFEVPRAVGYRHLPIMSRACLTPQNGFRYDAHRGALVIMPL